MIKLIGKIKSINLTTYNIQKNINKNVCSLYFPNQQTKIKHLSLKRCLFFSATAPQEKNYTSHKGENLHQNNNEKEKIDETISFLDLKQEIIQDINQYYVKYSKIKSSFQVHVENWQKLGYKQSQLIDILQLISNYPIYQMSNQTILKIYKIVCFNMHFKSVEQMNKLLLFVLRCDKNVSQSPIFLQFIKFYLNVPLQLLRIKYQINFDNESVIGVLKQYIARIIQQGFLPRSPLYERFLNVIQKEKSLLLIIENKGLQNCLMIKKLNYTIFLETKVYYQKQMKQNLYHEKKVNLLIRMSKYMKKLCFKSALTQNQNIYQRQLYIKLYLTIPNKKQLQQNQQLVCSEQLGNFRYQSVIRMYQFVKIHLKQLDNLGSTQLSEDVELLVEFVKRVEQNFTEVYHTGLNNIKIHETEEMYLIFNILLQKQNLTNNLLKQHLFEKISDSFTALNFKYQYQHAIILIKNIYELKQFTRLLLVLKNQDIYKMLQLSHISQISLIFTSRISNQPTELTLLLTIFQIIYNLILTTDYQQIGGLEIIQMLKIYNAYSKLLKVGINNYDPILKQNDISIKQNREVLRQFFLRYIADHHKQFKLIQFEKIIEILFSQEDQRWDKFNDDENNYPMNIYQQVQEYLDQVVLLFSQSVKNIVSIRKKSENIRQK